MMSNMIIIDKIWSRRDIEQEMDIANIIKQS